jgi:hypothetical protein
MDVVPPSRGARRMPGNCSGAPVPLTMKRKRDRQLRETRRPNTASRLWAIGLWRPFLSVRIEEDTAARAVRPKASSSSHNARSRRR